MKTSGVILEINKNRATVMTDEARFIVIKREPEMFIGKQVDLSRSTKRLWFTQYSPGLAIIAVFIIMSLSIFGYYRQNSLFAYVTIDINPSVEFSVNQEMRILSVRNLNHDALLLLRGTSLNNMPVDKALSVLVTKAEQKKYFHGENRFILISAATLKSSAEQPDLAEKLIKPLKTELRRKDIQVQFIQSTLAQRQLAFKNHLSMGRYALMIYANKNGHILALDEVKTGSISYLLDKSGVAKVKTGGNGRGYTGKTPDGKVRKVITASHGPEKKISGEKIPPKRTPEKMSPEIPRPEKVNPKKDGRSDPVIPGKNDLKDKPEEEIIDSEEKVPGPDETVPQDDMKKTNPGSGNPSPQSGGTSSGSKGNSHGPRSGK